MTSIKKMVCTVALVGAQVAPAQLNLPSGIPLNQTQSTAVTSAGSTPVDVVGIVVDARNRNPISRALVRFGSRAVLTDHDGVFTFPQVTSTSISFMASKPGFYTTPDGDLGPTRSYRLPVTTPIEIALYPEAIVSGSVTNQAGEGLSGLGVTAQRSVFDENGHRWVSAGQTQTLSSGEFRIAVPSGSYSLRISPRGHADGGTEVIMPLQVPAATSTSDEALKLLPGEEARLDLRTDVRRSYTVNLRFDTDGRGFPSLTAKTSNGGSIPLRPIPSRDQGEVRVLLPSGTYTLLGSIQNQDGYSEGQAQVTVTDHDVSGIVLRFSRAANLPVTIETDSSASLDGNNKLPDANQLGLTFQSVGPGTDGSSSSIHAVTRKAGQLSFPVPGGVYHLRAQAGGQWYVTAATCGGADLLSQDISVSAGLDGTEVRVRISNNTATLSGKLTISGEPGAAWVYLLATNPSATPVLIVRSNFDGSFFRPYLAPGSYRVVALERKVNADLLNNASLSRYLDRVQTFTITPGEQRTLTLNAVTERELSQ